VLVLKGKKYSIYIKKKLKNKNRRRNIEIVVLGFLSKNIKNLLFSDVRGYLFCY
jgi:hypothetical protein